MLPIFNFISMWPFLENFKRKYPFYVREESHWMDEVLPSGKTFRNNITGFAYKMEEALKATSVFNQCHISIKMHSGVASF
ncbi:hypothetical protein CEXT_540621 [Caerostris extrusa]|uniref:Uncharacterized protein n=1 Tax=Caerostris extrusa TaxID=172846 RepID=A0AAV4VNG7_CAEEX|nr:hypothetical protein CEXT_540621 [Caerostris extrusa]